MFKEDINFLATSILKPLINISYWYTHICIYIGFSLLQILNGGGGGGKGDKQQPLLGKFKFSTEATVLEVNSAKH